MDKLRKENGQYASVWDFFETKEIVLTSLVLGLVTLSILLQGAYGVYEYTHGKITFARDVWAEYKDGDEIKYVLAGREVKIDDKYINPSNGADKQLIGSGI